MRIVTSVVVVGMAALLQPAPVPQGPAPSTPLPARASPVVQTCVPCHGTRGEGKPDAGFPRIAGQSSQYLAKQLDDYAEGLRQNATMEPIARGLTPELRATVAAYYAQAEAPAAARASGFTAPWAERGRVLAISGDRARGVQACNNCHGPGGIGQPPAIPYLAGLDSGYLRATLEAWQAGTRRNDAGQQMAVVARALAPEDVAAVARYYAEAAPPQPVPLDVVQPGDPVLVPSGMTRSITVDTTESEQSGTEGRSPMSGGEGNLAQSGESSEAPGDSTRTTQDVAASGRGPAAPPAAGPGIPGDPVRGRALVASGTYGCTACHSVPDIRSPRGIVGPPLGGLAGRPFIAGQLPNTSEVLVRFLEDPPSLVPTTGMPDVGLSVEDARHIAAYLYTLPARNE